MSSIIKNKNKGFTLAELLIVITIIGVLIAFIIPVIANKIENSREAADIANVRSAYAEVMSNVITENDADASRIVKLKQKKDDWQTDPVTIAGITHHKGDIDSINWKGIPVANGECEISYDKTDGI
ncbi:MAG: type II secretion system GspH family protein [Lachnospiraceae bacterium]|nr:type II secretion system GspH family protein [Lachnospiraceae bacterium]